MIFMHYFKERRIRKSRKDKENNENQEFNALI